METRRGKLWMKYLCFLERIRICFIVYKYCHFTWICSILFNVFLPSCPMYWWSVSPGYMLLNSTKKKCMTCCQEKSLLVYLWSSLSAYPLFFTFSCFHALLRESLSHFVSFTPVFLANAPLRPTETPQKNLPILCSGHAGYFFSFFFYMNFKASCWLLRGRSHTLPWRLRDSLRGP